ncbi:VTT domain-containing protein [Patescibacteria group bacterium]|nr:VTT domain-containing protein [Patescibacteria group bacterium]
MRIKINKKIIIYAWILLLISVFVAYLSFPKIVNLENFLDVISGNYILAIFIFTLFVFLRGFTLISPLIVTMVSLLFFSPLEVFLINSFGIVVSSFLIYKVSDCLGFDDYFESNYKDKVEKIRKSFEKKEIPIMIGWSFFPFFPTDVLVYVAASLKVSLWRCLVGIFIGTVLINFISIYLAGKLMEYQDIIVSSLF